MISAFFRTGAVLLWALVTLPSSAWAADPAPGAKGAASPCAATSAALQESADQAWSTYASLDEDGFRAATDEMRQHLGCLVEPITRDLAASVHRLSGLRAATDGEKDRAALAFAAARALEPRWNFPESLFPKGHPFRALYEAFSLSLATWQPIPPTSAVVRIDGHSADARPTAWPAIVQVYGPDGAVLQSAYLWPEDPMVSLPPPSPDAPLGVAQVPVVKRAPWMLAGVAAASAGASAALYLSAVRSVALVEQGEIAPAGVETMARRANGLVLGSAGAGALALGAGALAVVQVRW